MGEPLIVLDKVSRVYTSGESTVVALDRIDIRIDAGEMVAIVGASGSGKSTLMNILGCLDRSTSGHYRIAGRDVASLDGDELAALRREHFGFIFQRYHLLGELTAIGNVEMPAVYAGLSSADRHDRAAGLLHRLGMDKRLAHTPGQLSGGQQQRVSIARALINGADVILADEPTGALDSRSGEEVLRILDEIHAEGRTVIIVTHDMAWPGAHGGSSSCATARSSRIVLMPTMTPPLLRCVRPVSKAPELVRRGCHVGTQD